MKARQACAWAGDSFGAGIATALVGTMALGLALGFASDFDVREPM